MTQKQALKRLIEISPEIAEWSDQEKSIFALCYLHGRKDKEMELLKQMS